MHARKAAAFLRAFGDATRLRILHALSVRPLTVGEMARVLKVPFPRISRHLRYLDVRGVVECGPRGRSVQYRLAPCGSPLHESVLAVIQQAAASMHEMQQDLPRLLAQER